MRIHTLKPGDDDTHEGARQRAQLKNPAELPSTKYATRNYIGATDWVCMIWHEGTRARGHEESLYVDGRHCGTFYACR